MPPQNAAAPRGRGRVQPNGRSHAHGRDSGAGRSRTTTRQKQLLADPRLAGRAQALERNAIVVRLQIASSSTVTLRPFRRDELDVVWEARKRRATATSPITPGARRAIQRYIERSGRVF